MGLVKRGNYWWMRFTYQGRQVRRSTGTTDRRLAEAIIGKVRVHMVEGRFFETLEEKTRTFEELMAGISANMPPKSRSHATIEAMRGASPPSWEAGPWPRSRRS